MTTEIHFRSIAQDSNNGMRTPVADARDAIAALRNIDALGLSTAPRLVFASGRTEEVYADHTTLLLSRDASGAPRLLNACRMMSDPLSGPSERLVAIEW